MDLLKPYIHMNDVNSFKSMAVNCTSNPDTYKKYYKISEKYTTKLSYRTESYT